MTEYHGIFPPLVTPIHDDESPDLDSLRRVVQFHVDEGVHGFWAMGTSAEFAAFDENERAAAASAVVEVVDGRLPVIVNVSDASTRLAIRHGKRAKTAGANAIAATPPYYYPHSQDEVLSHYRAIRDAVDLPLYIYNIPQTVRVRVELSTARALAKEGTASGIKDSQNDLEWLRALTLFVEEQSLPFVTFAGTRHLIDAGILAGAKGAIPSISNAFPRLCVAVYDAAMGGDFQTSARLQKLIITIEAVTGSVVAGSRNAVILGLQKALLKEWGIFHSAALTMPLRTPESTEASDLVARVQEIAPEWCGRVAQTLK